MSDDAKDREIAALKAQLAALLNARPQYATPPLAQEVSASQESSVNDVQQLHGSGNMVLKQITVAAGGTLIVGNPPELPSDAVGIQETLAIYLSTLLNHYRLLSFQGLSSSAQRRHAQIALQAVFINVPTNIQVPELHELANRLRQLPTRVQQRKAPPVEPFMFDQLSVDTSQWLAELMNADDYQALRTNQVSPTVI